MHSKGLCTWTPQLPLIFARVLYLLVAGFDCQALKALVNIMLHTQRWLMGVLTAVEAIPQNVPLCGQGYWVLKELQIFWFWQLGWCSPVFLGDYLRNIGIALKKIYWKEALEENDKYSHSQNCSRQNVHFHVTPAYPHHGSLIDNIFLWCFETRHN